MIDTGRRAWPFVLIGWRRWQSLSAEEKARYQAMVREYAAQGMKMVDDARQKLPRR